MVAGTPCMCMRTTGTPRSAHRGSSPGSRRPAETSFTTSAPSSSARRAIAALEVSTEIGTRTAARTARRTGRRRRRSSSAATGRAPGRVDSAPTSSIAAPSATISAAAAAARPGSRWRPPSENESGVAFRMPTSATRSRTRGPERVRRTGGPLGPVGRSGRGGRRVPEATVLGPELPEDLVDLGAVDRLALEEGLGHLVEHLEVAAQEELRALVGLEQEAAHLGVDLDGGLLGVVDLLREVAAEEDLLFLLAEGHRPELVAHTPLAHHLVRQLGGALDVVARPGRHAAERALLGRAPTEEDGELAEEVVLRVGVPVVERHLLRQPEGHAARNDGHLVHRVGARHQLRHQRVARLVVGDHPPFLDADDHRAPLGAHHDLVLGDLEVAHRDPVLVLARGEERRLVHQVLEVGAGEARRLPGQEIDVHVLADRHPAGVDLQDALAPLHVGARHDDSAIESAGTQERRVQDVRSIGGGDQDDALVGLEAVHLDQQLVERLLALVVSAAEARAAVAADGVDLVDEDDAGGVLLPLHEEVAHARGPDPDEHLDEVRARDGEEGHARLAGDGPGEERLAGAGRADQEHALRDTSAQLGELLRVLQEGDDLLELLLGLVDPRHVVEGDLVRVLGEQLGTALPEGHRLAAAHLHLAHEEHPDADQEEHGRPVHHRDQVPGLVVLRLDVDHDALVVQRLHQIRVLGRVGLEALAGPAALGLVVAVDGLALHADVVDLIIVHRLQEAAEGYLRLARLLLGHHGPEEQPEEQEEQPEAEIAGDWIQVGTGATTRDENNTASPERQSNASGGPSSARALTRAARFRCPRTPRLGRHSLPRLRPLATVGGLFPHARARVPTTPARPGPRASVGTASLGFAPTRQSPYSRAGGCGARSKTASTTRVVAGPTGAQAPRARPGTQRISGPAASTGRSARVSRGTLPSTRTSWSLRVPPASNRTRSPRAGERRTRPPGNASASKSACAAPVGRASPAPRARGVEKATRQPPAGWATVRPGPISNAKEDGAAARPGRRTSTSPSRTTPAGPGMATAPRS